ncbi:MAG: hypothetical protein QM667_10935 [Asticcacaulis sp.]
MKPGEIVCDGFIPRRLLPAGCHETVFRQQSGARMNYLIVISNVYGKYALWINIIIAAFALLSAIRFFLFLKGKETLRTRLIEALSVFAIWLPFDDPVKDYKDEELRHRAFLRKRKNRKPGHLTDEM